MASSLNIEIDHGGKTSYSGDTKTGRGCSDEEIQKLVESIENKINEASFSPSEYVIYRVLKPIREVKPEAYTPRLVSIGPFHRGSKHLWPMEAHKLRLLKLFLDRTPYPTLPDYVREMWKIQTIARQCYSEDIPLKDDEFLKMLVVDGCFILELIIGWKARRHDHGEPIFNDIWMPQIIRDLMLLENQLPFFVLQSLYKILYKKDDGSIHQVTKGFLSYFLPRSPTIIQKASTTRRFGNWVKSIFHSPSESSIDEMEFNKAPSEVLHSPSESKIDLEESLDPSPTPMPRVPPGGASHLLDYVRSSLVVQGSEKQFYKQPERIHCATELKKATVKFAKSATTKLSDITFKDGVLRIPAIHIDDLTESLLRNLIALEQSRPYDAKYVTAYAVFMDDLINSPEDVKLLQDEGILENLTSMDHLVVLFNKIMKEVTEPHEFCFSHVYYRLDRYYNNPWRKLLAKLHQQTGSLKSRYFRNTWSFISFLAAAALLGLTIAQTVAAFMHSNRKN